MKYFIIKNFASLFILIIKKFRITKRISESCYIFRCIFIDLTILIFVNFIIIRNFSIFFSFIKKFRITKRISEICLLIIRIFFSNIILFIKKFRIIKRISEILPCINRIILCIYARRCRSMNTFS